MKNNNQIVILQSMLNDIKFNVPKFKSYIKQEIKETQERKKQEEISNEIIRRLRIQNRKLMAQVASLKEQVKQFKTEKSEMENKGTHLLKLTSALSNALGSCSSCWGEDPECVTCGGNGAPAWRSINRRLFNIYVLPVLEKMYGINRN